MNSNTSNKLLLIPKIKSLKSIKPILNKYDLFIFDCDGVVYNFSNLLKGSMDTFHYLNDNNKEIALLTNNNITNTKIIHNKISKSFDKLKEANIFTSSLLLAKYLSNLNKKSKEISNTQNPNLIKKVFMLGNDFLKTDLEKESIEVVTLDEFNHVKYDEEADGMLVVQPDIDAVVIGFDLYINNFKLSYALNVLLNNKNAGLYGTNIDRYGKANKNYMLGTYSHIGAVEYAVDKKAVIVTKPDSRSLNVILEQIYGSSYSNGSKIDKSRILMIGDNMETDIKFANNSGIDSLLVFSGITKRDQVEEYVDSNDCDNGCDMEWIGEKYGVPTYCMDTLEV